MNIYLIQKLTELLDLEDKNLAEDIRLGFNLVGRIPFSGNYPPPAKLNNACDGHFDE